MASRMTLIQQFTRYALEIGAFQPGQFKLRSGRIAPYRFDVAAFNTGEALQVLSRMYVRVIEASFRFRPDVIFGPAYKGIPLATSIAQAMGGNIGWAYNRKEAKDHAEGGNIIGAPLRDAQVVIADDTITEGGTLNTSNNIIEAAGGTVIGVALVYDRQERGTGECSATEEFAEKYGIQVVAASACDDFVWCLQQVSPHCSWLEEIVAYRERYGARR